MNAAPPLFRLDGKVALVTGAATGLGAGIAVLLARQGAVIQLVRTLGLEWAKHGITVNSVAPTFVETNMTRARLRNPEFRNFVLGKIPCGKLATAEDVASAVAFLVSEQAGMINCETLRVDGGWTAW